VDGKPVRNMLNAVREASRLHLEGAGVASDNNPLVLDYCLDAWTRESEYVLSRAMRGVKLSHQYIYGNHSILKKHLSVALKGMKLRDLSAARVEKALMAMAAAGIGSRTINSALQALRVPVRYFCRLNRLPDPLQYIQPMHQKLRERGILTLAEVQALVALDMGKDDPRIRAAVLLGAMCGLRLGEYRGLLLSDIDRADGLLHIQHNFVEGGEGLKGYKWGSSRDVPLPSVVLEAIDACALMPRTSRSPFVLYNDFHDERPVNGKTVNEGFRTMLRRIGINEESRKARNLLFHGFRHTFVSLSRMAGLPDFVVQRLSGHKSVFMVERYSHAEIIDFAAARSAMETTVSPKKSSA
jgi:integrase